MKFFVWLFLCLLLVAALLLYRPLAIQIHNGKIKISTTENYTNKAKRDHNDNFYYRLAYSAEDIVDPSIIYDGSYQRIAYPGGDVAPTRGVCSDVIIRAYRKQDIDLQQLVHADMQGNFNAYPQKWNLTRPDANIDHRRVPNLAVFFQRHGETLPITNKADDYQPGDIVCWDLTGLPHIGIVSSFRSNERNRYQIVHNIGGGQVMEDVLFDYKITGHYRYQAK